MQDYNEFVEKFKPKLTTDDCYTPPEVYEAVKNWAMNEYGLQGREVIRPIYPGGDYVNYQYPKNCVVIDNPPFSILAQITAYFNEKKISYFLFAPHLTLFTASGSKNNNYIITDAGITYANGARVNTDFVTNMGNCFIRTAPILKKDLKLADAESKNTNHLPIYKYPDEVISAALLGKISTVDFSLRRNDCYFTRQLDAQKKTKKTIFGGGFLISDSRAAELRAAELRAAELRAEKDVTVWELSDREKEIIKNLK